MLKKILLILAAALAVLIVFIATRPADFTVERREVIAASPDIVHAQINDFANWKNWSPWYKMDTTTAITLSAPSAGEGATYAWESDKTGAGNMRITSSAPNRIEVDLNFVKPFKAENEVVFTLYPIHGGTGLVWSMTGTNNFMGKAFGLFFDMDEMVGGDFEKGLADIKRLAEIQSGWRTE